MVMSWVLSSFIIFFLAFLWCLLDCHVLLGLVMFGSVEYMQGMSTPSWTRRTLCSLQWHGLGTLVTDCGCATGSTE